MTDRPILFSAPMVLALLAGQKSQTRRILKPQPDMAKISQPCHPEPRGDGRWVWMARDDFPEYSFATADFKVRFAKGDQLWTRETWRADDYDAAATIYRADMPGDALADTAGIIKWKPGIHMHRGRSRLTLTVTDVRVRRLQEIIEADALAEGVAWSDQAQGFIVPGVDHPLPDFPILSRVTAREMYAALWDVINGSGQWIANSWVVALTFTVERKNIDAVRAPA